MEPSAFMDLVRRRRSVRRFKPDAVPREMIESCVEAARLSPSAENAQPWRFIAICSPDARKELSEAAFSGIFRFTKWVAEAKDHRRYPGVQVT